MTSLSPLAALEQDAVLCLLPQFGVLRFQGEDTTTFLHGQLSSDVKALPVQGAQYSSYSTPKGRMLANFMVLRQEDDYLLLLPRDLAPGIQKRLSMYILRSKTQAQDVSAQWTVMGIAGPAARGYIQRALGVDVAPPLQSVVADAVVVLTLAEDRFVLLVPEAGESALQSNLTGLGCTVADLALWQLGDIRSGIAWVTAPIQEEFVSLMLNMDLTGAVSFSKGCYPGQEIVARTRYLGKLKRRMYRVAVATTDVAIGQDVFSPELPGQAVGKVVAVAASQPGMQEMLVVAQNNCLDAGLFLDSACAVALRVLPLPYVLD